MIKSLVLFFCTALLFGSPILLAGSKSVVIASGDWHPYSFESEVTEPERLVNNLLLEAGLSAHWNYSGFEFAVRHIESGVANAGFPFFKSPEREAKFLYSQEIFKVKNSVIYHKSNPEMNVFLEGAGNGAFNKDDVEKLVDNFVAGKVSGYSYQGFSKSLNGVGNSYNSERQAISALLEGEIDFLPVASSVWKSMILRHFPDHLHKIAEVPELSWWESVYMMAPKNDAGREFIEKFDGVVERYKRDRPNLSYSYDLEELSGLFLVATVQLKSTDLFPVIKGYVLEGDSGGRTVVLPENTSALVLEWSESHFSDPNGTSLMSILKDKSKVLLVNGPHVGEIVQIQNDHIEVK